MHESFAEFLERKTTGNCTYKEFARLAVADDTFWDEPEIPHLIYSILHWECSKEDIDRYMTDCVRAWVHWVDSERRFEEWQEYCRALDEKANKESAKAAAMETAKKMDAVKEAIQEASKQHPQKVKKYAYSVG